MMVQSKTSVSITNDQRVTHLVVPGPGVYRQHNWSCSLHVFPKSKKEEKGDLLHKLLLFV